MANSLYDSLFGIHADKATPFLRLPDGRTITHQEFLTTTAQLANTLVRSGLEPGDRVVAQVRKSPEALALYAACVQAGLVYVPLNTAYTLSEISYFIENSGAALIVCDGSNQGSVAGVASRFGARVESLNADGTGSLTGQAVHALSEFPTVDRSADDLAAIIYTSGTTGRSKGAMLTHTNLLSNALTLAKAWRFTADDTLLHALPVFHMHGLFVACNVTLAAGGSMIYLPGFDLDQIFDLLPSATAMMGVPTYYTRLLKDARLTREAASDMRLFVSGSAPLLAETHRQFQMRTGHRILERYGMTETGMNTSNPYDGDRRAGTVGFPLPGIDLKITGRDDGKELPDGETGQIEVRGSNVFKGYWQMPDKTAADLREHGFFITGDLGHIDADGYVHIVGRNKDLIISGGYNIYPKEIELVLDSQPGVLESAVIGVGHPDFGETPIGVLVAQDGHVPDPVGIMEAATQSLARFKHPRRLIFLDELPRNAMGKVQKNLLRDRFKTMFTEN